MICVASIGVQALWRRGGGHSSKISEGVLLNARIIKKFQQGLAPLLPHPLLTYGCI